jgi:hypothetical protein
MPSDAEYGEVEGALRGAGVDSSSLAYVRTLKRNNLVGARHGGEGGGAGGVGGSSAAAQGGAALLDYVTKLGKMVLSGEASWRAISG